MSFGPHITQQEREEIIARCDADPVWFQKRFLPHWFPRDIPWFHKGLIAVLTRRFAFLNTIPTEEQRLLDKHFIVQPNPDSPVDLLPKRVFEFGEDGKVKTVRLGQYTLVLMPRGHSKTTDTNSAILLMMLLGEKLFPLYVSESAGHAESQLAAIKRELETNDLLRQVFGNRVPKRSEGLKWANDHIELRKIVGVDQQRLKAKGRDGQIRGGNEGSERYDIIICDDIEDRECVKTEEQRSKVREIFLEDIIPALSVKRGADSSTVVVLATLLHKEALPTYLMRDPRWTVIRLGAAENPDTLENPIWPDMYDTKFLEAKRDMFARVGNLAGFYREFFNIDRYDATAIFKKEYIHHMGFEEEMPQFIARAMAVDPAFGKTRTADYCAFAVVGITDKGRYVVLDAFGEKALEPHKQVDAYLDLWEKWRPHLCGYDCHGQQEYFADSIRTGAFTRWRTQRFQLQGIGHPHQQKIEFIKSRLQFAYANGMVTHRTTFPLLEQQLLDLRSDGSSHDDLPDVVAMCFQLLANYTPLTANFTRDSVDFDSSEFPDKPFSARYPGYQGLTI